MARKCAAVDSKSSREIVTRSSVQEHRLGGSGELPDEWAERDEEESCYKIHTVSKMPRANRMNRALEPGEGVH